MTPTTRTALSRDFHRQDIRAEFERSRRALKAGLAEGGLDQAAVRLIEHSAALDGGVARLKRDLLTSSLCWNDEHQALVSWICQENEQLAEMAQRVLEGCGKIVDGALSQAVAAAALFHWGEAVKWSTRRARQNYQPLHAIMDKATAGQRQRSALRVVADGRGRTATLESLYFRALLLDRFGGGSLTRQQIEVLDAWLWEWTATLCGVTRYPGGRVFRVDLDGNTGLRDGKRAVEGRSLYLQLEPIEARRRQVIQELHHGHIVPAHGCAADMRVEEHVAALDQLKRAIESASEDTACRAERSPGSGVRLEVWLGLSEILSRGVAPPPIAVTGSWKVSEDVRAAIAAGNRNHPALNLSDDPSRRYLWLTDVSDSGFGFEALGRDAMGIEVGDLLGWRKAAGEPCVIGKVVRRVPGSSPGQVFLGVQRLTAGAQPLRLVEEVNERELSENSFVFVSGADDSGRHDAFLLPDSVQRDNTAFSARVGNDLFKLRFNRVRNKGRGWVLAGFEILTAESPQPAAVYEEVAVELPKLELTLADHDAYDRAVGRELGSRLMN
jgi:hypothetical protein